MADEIMTSLVEQYAPESAHPGQWELDVLSNAVKEQFGFDFRSEGIEPDALGAKALEEALIAKAHEKYDEKEAMIGAQAMRYHERMIMLQIADSHWKDHLLAMDHLKEGIGLRGYGQRDPLVEYKKESYDLFEDLMNRIDEDSLRFLFLLQPFGGSDAGGEAPVGGAGGPGGSGGDAGGGRGAAYEEKMKQQIERKQRRQEMILNQIGGDAESGAHQAKRDASKVGRNDPCPCGSGKKFKKCHGAAA